ncbi:hypothetical protein C0993_007110, partial [Termitomyces sp. T159_Od127]
MSAEEDRGPAIVDCDLLEAAKENVQPLGTGRRVTALSTVLATPHAQRDAVLAAQRRRLREDVVRALGADADADGSSSHAPDALEAYTRLVTWTLEHYPQGPSVDSGLLELLEEATRVLLHHGGGRWRGAPRYLRLWLLYAGFVDRPTVVYRFLLANEVGTGSALLYEEWAAVLERDGSPHGHPYLHEPLLYISNVPAYLTDEALAMAFVACGPFRPRIARDTAAPVLSGTIEFRFLDKAEKALATLQARPVPGTIPPVVLVLSPYPPTSPPTPLPPPSALPRLVKHLPPAFSDAQLYDLFRPFGALASAHTHTHFGPDTGTVEFWNEDDARAAEDAMHCADVDGRNIAVHVYQSRRTSAALSDFNSNAPPFVPAAPLFPPQSPRGSPYSLRAALPAPFVHGPGQQVQLAPLPGPGSSSHSGLIDPCNLFCKASLSLRTPPHRPADPAQNLDPAIDSNDLFSHFRKFGQIVRYALPRLRARATHPAQRTRHAQRGRRQPRLWLCLLPDAVPRYVRPLPARSADPAPPAASTAMHAMNGAQLGAKQIVVRLHEPKQLRQEKLAQRFGHNGHPRSASGATSPAASEQGDAHPAFASPRRLAAALAPAPSAERARRGSGSYYNASPVLPSTNLIADRLQAALSGTLSLPMRYDDLAGLSPVVRREVLTGELARRVAALPAPPVPDADIAHVVDSLVGLALSEVVLCIEDPAKLESQVRGVLRALHPGQVEPEPASEAEAEPAKESTPEQEQERAQEHAHSPARSQDSRLLDAGAAAAATASAPEHPSTPVSVSPPRAASPGPGPASAGLSHAHSHAHGASERERLHAAVCKLARARADELVALLMSLPRRERALCVFNEEVLRGKVRDAMRVLEAEAEEGEGDGGEGEGGDGDGADARSTRSAPATPARAGADEPKTPELSSRGPSAAASPLPGTPGAGAATTAAATGTHTHTHTLASLAQLPASEIVRLASAGSAGGAGLALPLPDAGVVRATDEFVDGLAGLSVPMRKQALGDRLFKVVKAFGVRGA